MALELRPVTLENADTTLPQVLKLVQALASNEKAPDAVEANVPLLRQSFFGSDGGGDGQGERYARGVLAYRDGEEEAVGMAVYFVSSPRRDSEMKSLAGD